MSNDRKTTAAHEAGHAVAMLCCGCCPKFLDLYMDEDGDCFGGVRPASAMDELTRYVVAVAGGLAVVMHETGAKFVLEDSMPWLAGQALRRKPDGDIDGPCIIISPAGKRAEHRVCFDGGDLDAAAAGGPLVPALLLPAVDLVRRFWDDPEIWQRVRGLADESLLRLGNADKVRLTFDANGNVL